MSGRESSVGRPEPLRARGPEPAGTRGKELALWTAAVAALAAVVLLVHAPLFKPGRLHIQHMYVDQAGYITTARILADTGELRNGVLLPAHVEDPDIHVHMPGHSAVLALAYVLFGWGVLQSLLPSLAGYVLAAAGVFLIANRLYGRAAGVLAALIFALYPANVAYAFTAMAELTFTCACAAAFALFVHLPPRWQTFTPPVLLVLPFLFRESGAFLVIPMAAIVLRARGPAAAAAASAGSVASLYLVNRWQVASGKVQASLAWVTEGTFNYGDAFDAAPARLTSSEWLGRIAENAGRNLGILAKRAGELPGELMPWCLYAVLAACIALLVLGIPCARRDPFPLAVGLLMALVVALTISLYDAKLHKLVRTAMFTHPFAAVALAGVARPAALGARLRAARPRARAAALAALLALAAGAAAGSYAVSRRAGFTLCEYDRATIANTARLAEMHDPAQVLVAANVAAQYAVEHYPVVWSLPPDNEPTLDALMRRRDVGTIILDRRLSEAFVRDHGLVMTHSQNVARASWLYFYKTEESLRRLRGR